MPGLLDTLNLGARSLQVQQTGIEVAGHNLANVNQPGYARQRVHLATTPPLPTSIGPLGTGVDAVAIRHLRDALLDAQITRESSVRGFLEAHQKALQLGQAILGQEIDRQASSTGASTGAQAVGNPHGLADGLSDLFNAFQSLSLDPASLTERQHVLAQAESLAASFQQMDRRLGALQTTLNDALQAEIAKANQALADIARLNQQIIAAEAGGKVTANDLRDTRQQRLEELARLANIQAVPQSNGAVDVVLGGVLLVSGVRVEDTLALYDAGGGQMLVRTTTGATPLPLTSGSLQGAIEARDGPLRSLRNDLDTLAATLISQVNAVHRQGFGLTGATGQDFFTGTGAADMAVNPALRANPALLQASGVAGAVGDNQVALALAQLARAPQPALAGQTFSASFARTTAALGQALASTTQALNDQEVVDKMLLRQRDAVSGVSLDEEMTDLMKFQKAYEASAKLIATVDEMLATLMAMKR